MQDPTREELREALSNWCDDADPDLFEVEEAIYWFANDYHGGQWSNLYQVLCNSPYSPGPLMSTERLEDLSRNLYDELVERFG